MGSPDLIAYHGLTLYDVLPADLVDRAVADAAAKMPDWVPREGNMEMVLIEALSLIAAEVAFAINRVPGAITEVFIRLFEIERDLGTAATATATFNLSDTLGHTIPAGTRLLLDLGGGETLEFTTDAGATAAAGQASVTTDITAVRNTDDANGTAIGTALELLSAVAYVDSVELATAVAAGADPEDETAWRDRAVQTFRRLVSTLVLPEHFTAAALDDALVFRATTLDNYDPGQDDEQQTVAITGGPTGGTFTLTFDGQTTAAIAFDATAAAVQTALEALSNVDVGEVSASGGPLPGTGVVVEFRNGLGGQDVAAMTGDGTLLTGGAAPAVTVTETRKGGQSGPGSHAGHVTTAVLGSAGALLAQADKTTLHDGLESKTLANLDVHVVDPVVNTVNVTATVVRKAGFTDQQVTDNVTAALNDYLDPDAWEWGDTVYRNELIVVVDAAEGVERVVTLDVPAADVVLAGRAPLVDAGTVTVTVQAP